MLFGVACCLRLTGGCLLFDVGCCCLLLFAHVLSVRGVVGCVTIAVCCVLLVVCNMLCVSCCLLSSVNAVCRLLLWFVRCCLLFAV